MFHEETAGNSKLKVKLRCGASLVRVKPLFTYDSKCIIVASGSDVKIYSIQSGECLNTLRYHKSCVISLQEYKKNRLQLLSCSEDGIVVRWDYLEGRLLEVHDLKWPVVSFYAPTASSTWFITRKVKDKYRFYSLVAKTYKITDAQVIFNPFLPNENAIAFGFEGKFVAVVSENVLSIYNFDTKKFRRHVTGTRKLTCVTCHPTEFVLATGDDQGRVLVWSNLIDPKKVIKTIYHWHSLPVADIAFSSEGCYLYSGGGEASLVKWNLFSDHKSILPRLGAPIHRLNVAPDNSYIVTAHEDNALQIINPQSQVVQVIQGLTQGYFQGTKGNRLLPTGLLYDSLTKALVLNGKPGHLQFYNVHEDKQLFNLDIAMTNFITREREAMVLNIDVYKAAILDKGHWLATVQYWNDEVHSPQIWLKFWQFDVSKQNFVLNTNVFMPHYKEVNCIIFRPSVSPDYLPLAITTGSDCRFKIWVLNEDACCADKLSWTCESMGSYRDLSPGDACFSEDGALLAVAFNNSATLWTVDKPHLNAVLCHEKNSNPIKQLVFGKQSCSHLLMCKDATSLAVWNVLSLSMTWIIHTAVQSLVADIASDIVAAFCQDQTLILFKPDNPEPVFSIENISEHQIISAIFVPTKEDHSEIPFMGKSQLFFFDADQNLLTLTNECDEMESDIQKVTINQNVPVTPFGMLQAESQVSYVEVLEPQTMNIPINQELDITSPTLMDPLALCSKVLKSLLYRPRREKCD